MEKRYRNKIIIIVVVVVVVVVIIIIIIIIINFWSIVSMLGMFCTAWWRAVVMYLFPFCPVQVSENRTTWCTDWGRDSKCL